MISCQLAYMLLTADVVQTGPSALFESAALTVLLLEGGHTSAFAFSVSSKLCKDVTSWTLAILAAWWGAALCYHSFSVLIRRHTDR